MNTVALSEGYTVEYLVEKIRVTIPGKKNGKLMAFEALWLLFVALLFAGFCLALYSTLLSADWLERFRFPSIINFLIPTFILVLIGFFSSFSVYSFFWQLGGIETIEISPSRLMIQKTVFGFGRTKILGREQIKGIKVLRPMTVPLVFSRVEFARIDVPTTGPIQVLLTNRKMEYIGLGLDREQAKKLVELIRQQFSLPRTPA